MLGILDLRDIYEQTLVFIRTETFEESLINRRVFPRLQLQVLSLLVVDPVLSPRARSLAPYLFTRLKNSLLVLQTMGVVKVIKFGGEIAVIQNDSIRAIKLMIEGGYMPEAIDYFVKGEKVEVKNGPLKGLIGEVTRVDNNDRLLVRVDAIQHSVSVQIDRGYLKSV